MSREKLCVQGRARDIAERFDAAAGPSSRGTLYERDRKTVVKDWKKKIGKELIDKMLDDLGIDRNEL